MKSGLEVVSERWQIGLNAMPPVERSVENGRVREIRRFRGLTAEQAIGYLENLGGRRRSETEIEGDQWEAKLTVGRVPVGPSYRLTEVTITWVGDMDVLEPIIYRFRRKAFRAPG